MELYKVVARQFPDLKLKLLQARMPETPEHYVQKTVMTGAMMAGAILFIIFMFYSHPVVFFAFPFLFGLMFLYFFHFVDMRIQKMNKEVSREIVYAGRFLIIELESGVPMYQAFKNVSKNYEYVGLYFQEMVERIDLGTPMEDALNETITLAPSPDLRKMLWQLLNSLKTGGEATAALSSVFDQIVREQQIAVKEYGRKLNPLAMFYMMIAIIVPSLGTIMLIVLASFLGFNIDLIVYVVIAGVIGFIQFMFLAVMKSSRPPTEM